MSPLQIKQIKHKQSKAKRKMFFRKWHRRIGFSASLFLFNLAITGIMLNHYEVFNLQDNHVKSSWLLDWYDIKHTDEIYCLAISNSKVCQIDSELFIVSDSKDDNNIAFLSDDFGKLITINTFNTMIYLVTDKNVLMFDEEFQFIDNLNIVDELSENISSALFTENKLYLKTEIPMLSH